MKEGLLCHLALGHILVELLGYYIPISCLSLSIEMNGTSTNSDINEINVRIYTQCNDSVFGYILEKPNICQRSG